MSTNRLNSQKEVTEQDKNVFIINFMLNQENQMTKAVHDMT